MSIFKKAKDKVVTSVIKGKVKKAANEKLNLNGEYDQQLDQVSENIINRVGVDNILKAKKIIETIKS